MFYDDLDGVASIAVTLFSIPIYEYTMCLELQENDFHHMDISGCYWSRDTVNHLTGAVGDFPYHVCFAFLITQCGYADAEGFDG